MLNVPQQFSNTKVVPALSCPTTNPVAPEPACVTGSPVWNLPPPTVPPVKLSCASWLVQHNCTVRHLK